MYDYEYYYNIVKEKLYQYGESGKRRFEHSIGVALECERLAKINDIDNLELHNKAIIAGILHDYAKFATIEEYNALIKKYNLNIKIDEEFFPIYHGFIGYLMVEEELDFHDKEILNAIIYHSTGCKDMTLLEKCLFIADYTEPNRIGAFFDEVRKYAYTDIDYACYMEAKETYDYLKNKNRNIFYLTNECYDFYKNIIENRRING